MIDLSPAPPRRPLLDVELRKDKTCIHRSKIDIAARGEVTSPSTRLTLRYWSQCCQHLYMCEASLGLADARLAAAMRHMHGNPARLWTVDQLARKVALSRSAFFERFTRAVGLPPMEYLLAWRMAVAKNLLSREDVAVVEVAERVGCGSASTFSTAFSRHVGLPPSRFTRERRAQLT
jgi:transcriptional regulator GlxA family with amidase domain